MPTLQTTVDGLKLPNPFVIGSGPPGTNLNVITTAFKEGWGAVIAKTVSLDASKVINVTPRYGKLHSSDGKEVIGWENIELISDRPFKIWNEEFKKCKDRCIPTACSSPRSWRSTTRTPGSRSSKRCEACGVDAFELNFSCPHGLPERKMGAAMGEDPEILAEVVRLGDGRGDEAGLGEDDAERHAHRRPERAPLSQPARRASARSTRFAASWA